MTWQRKDIPRKKSRECLRYRQTTLIFVDPYFFFHDQYLAGREPLTTDLIALIGISLEPSEHNSQFFGAYCITWWDQALPFQTDSTVSTVGGDFYTRLLVSMG